MLTFLAAFLLASQALTDKISCFGCKGITSFFKTPIAKFGGNGDFAENFNVLAHL